MTSVCTWYLHTCGKPDICCMDLYVMGNGISLKLYRCKVFVVFFLEILWVGHRNAMTLIEHVHFALF